MKTYYVWYCSKSISTTCYAIFSAVPSLDKLHLQLHNMNYYAQKSLCSTGMHVDFSFVSLWFEQNSVQFHIVRNAINQVKGLLMRRGCYWAVQSMPQPASDFWEMKSIKLESISCVFPIKVQVYGIIFMMHLSCRGNADITPTLLSPELTSIEVPGCSYKESFIMWALALSNEYKRLSQSTILSSRTTGQSLHH